MQGTVLLMNRSMKGELSELLLLLLPVLSISVHMHAEGQWCFSYRDVALHFTQSSWDSGRDMLLCLVVRANEVV